MSNVTPAPDTDQAEVMRDVERCWALMPATIAADSFDLIEAAEIMVRQARRIVGGVSALCNLENDALDQVVPSSSGPLDRHFEQVAAGLSERTGVRRIFELMDEASNLLDLGDKSVAETAPVLRGGGAS